MSHTSGGIRKVLVALAVGSLAVVAAACSSNNSSSTTTTSGSSTTTTPAIPTTKIPTQSVNTTLAASVPASVKSGGDWVVAMDATYPPNEFIAADGHTIVGMDADMVNAIAQTLGLTPKLTNVTFDDIIPGIQSGRYGMGASSFTDTLARQKVVDFVTYFQAGESFYVKSDSSLALDGLTSLCGHTVAVEAGTTEESDAKAQAKKCPSSSKLTVLSFSTQSEANLAVSSGRAQVGFADSPVAEYIVATSNGAFKNSGSALEVAPYGFALPKGNGMATPVQGAVNALIQNGVYGQILKKWGLQSGAVTTASINAATS